MAKVIGVDPHKRMNAVVVLDAKGKVLDSGSSPTPRRASASCERSVASGGPGRGPSKAATGWASTWPSAWWLSTRSWWTCPPAARPWFGSMPAATGETGGRLALRVGRYGRSELHHCDFMSFQARERWWAGH